MLDELAHAGAEHLDPGFVAGFDRKQGYPDPAEDPLPHRRGSNYQAMIAKPRHGLSGQAADPVRRPPRLAPGRAGLPYLFEWLPGYG
jgi:hypothetical protein